MAENNSFSNGQLKKRYKMYKSGKNMLIAPLIFAGLLAFTPQTAKADDAANQPSVDVKSSSIVTNQVTDQNSNKLVFQNNATSAVDSDVTSDTTPISTTADANTKDTVDTQSNTGASQADNNAVATTDLNTNESNGKMTSNMPVTANANQYGIALYAATDTSSIDVYDAQGLWNALNGSYTTINVMNDIDFGAKYKGQQAITNNEAFRKFTIVGKNKPDGSKVKIDFGTAFVNFDAQAYQGADITIENLDLTGVSWWGPISFNCRNMDYMKKAIPNPGVVRKITYRDVTYTGCQLIASYHADINIEGTVIVNAGSKYAKINSKTQTLNRYDQQGFEVASLNVADGATLDVTTDHGIAIAVLDNTGTGLTIGKNANVNLRRINGKPGETEFAITGEHDSVLYSAGKVHVKSGATLNVLPSLVAVESLPKDADIKKNGGVVYINNNGEMTIDDGAKVNVATKDIAGSVNTPLIFLNGDGQLNVNNGELNLGNTSLGNDFSNIYVRDNGTIRVTGPQAKLIADSAGSDHQGASRPDGVINLHNGGNLFVSDGATMNVKNVNSDIKAKLKGEYLINVDGQSTLAFSKGAKVNLQTTGSGKDAIIVAGKDSHITIDRPDYVIFDMQSTGEGSKIFNFTGDVNARYVKVTNSQNYDPVGPYKTFNFSLNNGDYAGSTIVGKDGYGFYYTQIEDVAKNHYLKYVADDTSNFVKIDQKDSITSNTTELTGTTEANAYVTIYTYGETGQLTEVPGLNTGKATVGYTEYQHNVSTNPTRPVVKPSEVISYAVKADDKGHFSIKLPAGTLAANQIIVAKSTNVFTEAYDTAYVHDPADYLTPLEQIVTDAKQKVVDAKKANEDIQKMVLDDGTKNNYITHNEDVVTKATDYGNQAQTDIDGYQDPVAKGNQAAQDALDAINAYQEEIEANAINDPVTAGQKNNEATTKTNSANTKIKAITDQSTKLKNDATDLRTKLDQLEIWYPEAQKYAASYDDTYIAIDVNGQISGNLTSPIHFYKAGDFTVILPADQLPSGTSYKEYSGPMGSFTPGWGYTNGVNASTGMINFVKDQLASAKSGDYYLPVTITFSDNSTLTVLKKLHVQKEKKQEVVNNHNLKITGSYTGSFKKGDKLDNSKLTLNITADNGVAKTMSGKELQDLVATAGDNGQVTLTFGNKFGYNNGLFGKNNGPQTINVTAKPVQSRKANLMLFAASFVVNPSGQILSSKGLPIEEMVENNQAQKTDDKSGEGTPVDENKEESHVVSDDKKTADITAKTAPDTKDETDKDVQAPTTTADQSTTEKTGNETPAVQPETEGQESDKLVSHDEESTTEAPTVTDNQGTTSKVAPDQEAKNDKKTAATTAKTVPETKGETDKDVQAPTTTTDQPTTDKAVNETPVVQPETEGQESDKSVSRDEQSTTKAPTVTDDQDATSKVAPDQEFVETKNADKKDQAPVPSTTTDQSTTEKAGNETPAVQPETEGNESDKPVSRDEESTPEAPTVMDDQGSMSKVAPDQEAGEAKTDKKTADTTTKTVPEIKGETDKDVQVPTTTTDQSTTEKTGNETPAVQPETEGQESNKPVSRDEQPVTEAPTVADDQGSTSKVEPDQEAGEAKTDKKGESDSQLSATNVNDDKNAEKSAKKPSVVIPSDSVAESTVTIPENSQKQSSITALTTSSKSNVAVQSISAATSSATTQKNIQLPQTGNSKGELVAGLALGTMLALFGFGLGKKREY